MALDTEPNPPQWPESVILVRETDDKEKIRELLVQLQDEWNEEHKTFTSDRDHFSDRRRAVLFAPGTYSGEEFRFQVGYYVQAAGLGHTPDLVRFTNGAGPFVDALNQHLHPSGKGSSLDTFWRSAENFFMENDMSWAVSQAAPLRRIHVGGKLHLTHKFAYSSGGHLANSVIDGELDAGSQQQFLVRNCHIEDEAIGGAWSMVYVGCTGRLPDAGVGDEKSPSVTIIEEPRVRVEKPYIAMKKDNTTFELRVPDAIVREQSNIHFLQGPMIDGSHERIVDFIRVRVIRPTDPITDIQMALDTGKDVVLTPGIYQLQKTIFINHPNQVLLGLGLATLVAPTTSSPCIQVLPGVPGVRIAGIMLEASDNPDSETSSSHKTGSLLEWGQEGKHDPGVKENPGALFDVFCRVGGANIHMKESVYVDTMMRIHSGHVVGDNLWLWRADHAALLPGQEANYPNISPIFWQTEEKEYRVETGFKVTGDDVIIYGLAVEHANGHQTVWTGERGAVHFYQCELPYDVYRKFQESGFRGYLVGGNVLEHVVYAPGIYSNFRNDNVEVSTAIEHPERSSIRCVNPFTVKLDNGGSILSVVNGKGAVTSKQGIPVRYS